MIANVFFLGLGVFTAFYSGIPGHSHPFVYLYKGLEGRRQARSTHVDVINTGRDFARHPDQSCDEEEREHPQPRIRIADALSRSGLTRASGSSSAASCRILSSA
ncbi:MAG: hypothetical protein MZU91_00510 [Desulfosudis oleivorans]|nr:hypothetical protein [Desulfosudis oleivorans]